MQARKERRSTVLSAGAELAVFEYGPPPAHGVPTLLLVHGYPDDHQLFLPAIAELAVTHHVIAYDTRNAGMSSVKEPPGDFTLNTLVNDLFAVLASTGAANVHLIGHDWGSIQGWAAVQDPRASGVISRFTSISGPDLGHFLRWMRSRAGNLRGWPQLVAQLLRSSYIAAFQVPLLPEAAWRLFLTRLYENAAGRRVNDNPIRGLALYRSNRFPSGKVKAPTPVGVPVTVVVPLKDPFLSPHLTAGLRSWVTDLTVIPVDGGHWWPATHHKELAGLLRAS
ncbi:alpha/beta fold hydrolase [Arthrobacter globiformis]|uniref:alpha/beta fold hydrolase n=1 Tax=Arthrobacter globiformis TaxID=1665 RepID=UPI00278CF498|nr:alpha/beta fold hydrolase [Arthrobacter globiformis]MDQ0617079.1 pimeloyl-ACP methyl ester carboxylesterase [Arthrobacter globiformis]